MKKTLLSLIVLSSISQQAFAADRVELCENIKQLLTASQSIVNISAYELQLATGSAKQQALVKLQSANEQLNEDLVRPFTHQCISDEKAQDTDLENVYNSKKENSMSLLATQNPAVIDATRLAIDVDYTMAIMK